jgi:Dynein heavy chain region D6 P-loop domain
MREYSREKLGGKFTEARTIEFAKSFEESSNITPIFFILSPGVDPLKDVEKVGKSLHFSVDYGNFHNVSLGQGQEIVAENAIDTASKMGHWVILQVSLNLLTVSNGGLIFKIFLRIFILLQNGSQLWRRKWSRQWKKLTQIIDSSSVQSQQSSQVKTNFKLISKFP